MWKERYKIGIDLIDEQHEELFNRLASFIEAVLKGTISLEAREEISSNFEFLDGYFEGHFKAEETYQKEIGFPDYKKHSLEHRNFRREIAGYLDRHRNGGLSEKELKSLCARLMTWLIVHVGYEDQKIGDYARDKGLI